MYNCLIRKIEYIFQKWIDNREKKVIVFAISIIAFSNLYSQSGADFTIPDTICINDSVIIVNNSPDASSYYWNFCSGNLAHNPEGENLGNPGTLNGPAFIDFVFDKSENKYYSFITNHTDINNASVGSITRNTYENSFLTEPISENLGSFSGLIPVHAQGIQIEKDDSNWYIFVVGGQHEESRLVRLSFGNSLSNNNPIVNNLGNIGELNYPVDLYIDYIDESWIGFTVNKNSNTVTRFNFGNSLKNEPTAINLGNPANLSSPCGIFPIKNNNDWYMFISNYDGNDISRLNFGNSLINDPTGVIIGGNDILNFPFDLTILRDCERTYGFILNRFNDIVRLEFNNGLDEEPEYESLGKTGDLYNPQGISKVFRVGDSLYTFVANIDNSSITRLCFPGCTNATPASSTNRNPPAIHYNEPGIYNINLVIDEGTATQSNYCANVVVLENPEFSLGNDTIIPAGSSVILSSDSAYSAYLWSTGSNEPNIEVNEAGVYTLTITNEYGCKSTDDIEVILDIGIPNFITPNGDGYNDTWIIPFLFNKPESEIIVFDRFGNTVASYKYGMAEWDGTSNGAPLPEGTYWYIIKVPGINKPYKGAITIKR